MGNKLCDAVICTIDSLKGDAEVKLLVGCLDSEKEKILAFYNDGSHMSGIMLKRQASPNSNNQS